MARRTAAGLTYSAGESAVTDGSGNRFHARLAVFPSGPERVQSFVFIASDRAAMDGCEAEWMAFLGTIQPQAAVAPAPPPPKGPERPGEFQNFRYTIPAGWVENRQTGFVSLSPARLQGPEQLAIVLLPSRPVGPWERELPSVWQEILALNRAQPMRNVSGQAFDAEAPRRTAAGWDYVTANGGIMVGNQVYSVRPYLFRVRDRVERAYVMAADFRADLVMTNAMSSPRWEPEIYRFLFTLRFGDAAAAPGRGPALAEGPAIAGVWGGAAMSFGSIKPHFAIFFADGAAYFGPRFPTHGLVDIDPAIERERSPRDWGSWTLSGPAGILRMPYGEIPIRVEGASLVLTTSNTPHRYVRFAVPPPAALAGTWCLSDGECVRLHPDGRFQDQGALRVMEHATYPFPLTPTAGQGRYAVSRHSITFRFDDGGEFRLAAPGIPAGTGSGPPAQLWLSFNLDVVTRR